MIKALLTSTYFGPVQWYQKLNRYTDCLIECHDSYLKQTYRNRCLIATANGIQALSVPIEKYDGQKCEMKDIRISDHGNWRHLHWNALMSAYGESPFFEFYADELHPFFEKKWDFLLDFNMEITQKMCNLIDIHPHISFTKEYDTSMKEIKDFRELIRPKHSLDDNDFTEIPYYQVYKQKFGFQKNLSILDLLLNEGNESIYFL